MRYLHFFLLVCLFSSATILCAAETESILIKSIAIQSSSDQEKIHLDFENQFNNATSQHFDSGIVRITLPYTSYKKETETKHVNDRFIRIIRLYKEGSSSILEIQFADAEFQAIGKVSSQTNGNTLSILIDKSASSSDFVDSGNQLFSNKTTNPQATPISFSNELLEGNDITVNIIKMLLAVAAILIFFYGIMWIYNKFFVSRFSFKKEGHTIKMVTSYHISPKQKIIVLDVDNSTFACGVTANNISLIAEVTDKSFYNYLSQLKPDYEKGIDFTRLRTQYLESKSAKSNEESLKPKVPFASELLQKVKKLKPID